MSESEEVLIHHGIKGQRWGVRRTPEQLGHTSNSGGKGTSNREKVSSLSDEELRKRIQRLNMEEQYISLVKRKEARDTGQASKLLGQAVEQLAGKAVGLAIDIAISKATSAIKAGSSEKFRTTDIEKMDPDMLSQAARWYENALKISQGRAKLAGGD